MGNEEMEGAHGCTSANLNLTLDFDGILLADPAVVGALLAAALDGASLSTGTAVITAQTHASSVKHKR